MEINRINYEKFFLLYLDRELNPAEMLDVEKFLGENSDLKKEFMLLQQTVFMPEEILFDQKESLLRKEEKRRIVPFYYMRMAAAIALLILGSWFIISQIIKIQKSVPAAEQSAVAKNRAKENISNAAPAIGSPANQKPGPSDKLDNTANPSADKEISENKTGEKLSNRDKESDQAKHSNDLANNQPPAEPTLALRKSSAALEVQSVAMQAGDAPRPVSTQPGNNGPVLVMVSTPKTEPPVNEKTVLQEQDFQTDNAISVVALNDPNKGISKFLKKLTRSAPAEDNARKVRVSVFQISY